MKTEETTQINIRVPVALKEKVKRLAVEDGRTVTGLLLWIVDQLAKGKRLR